MSRHAKHSKYASQFTTRLSPKCFVLQIVGFVDIYLMPFIMSSYDMWIPPGVSSAAIGAITAALAALAALTALAAVIPMPWLTPLPLWPHTTTPQLNCHETTSLYEEHSRKIQCCCRVWSRILCKTFHICCLQNALMVKFPQCASVQDVLLFALNWFYFVGLKEPIFIKTCEYKRLK